MNDITIEDKVHITRDNHYSLEYRDYDIFFNARFEDGKLRSKQDIYSIATDVLKVSSALADLFGEEIIYPGSSMGYKISFDHLNSPLYDMQLRENLRNYSSEKSQRIRTIENIFEPIRFFKGLYNDENLLFSDFSWAVNLLAEEDIKHNFVYTTDEVLNLINKMKVNLDEKISSIGISPTQENRSRIIFYLFYEEIFDIKEISNFSNLTSKDCRLDKPSFIRKAASGYDINFLNLLYVYDYFPKDKTEVEPLTKMPLEWLTSVLNQ
jgi:hypothetical protein